MDHLKAVVRRVGWADHPIRLAVVLVVVAIALLGSARANAPVFGECNAQIACSTDPATGKVNWEATGLVQGKTYKVCVGSTCSDGFSQDSNEEHPGCYTYSGSFSLAPGSYTVTLYEKKPHSWDNKDSCTTTLKVTPTVTVNGGTFTYDGAPHPATASATYGGNSVAGTFGFTYNGGSTAPKNAGAYSVVATFTPSDQSKYTTATGTGTITINKAVPSVTVSGGPFTYDGSPHAASVTVSGAGTGSTAVTYNGSTDVPTNAGTYNVVATFTSSDPNYSNATGTGTLTIKPATPTVSVPGGTFTYDGSAHPATATAAGVGGASVDGTFAFTYSPGGTTPPTNAGTYSVSAAFTSSNANYTNATGTGTIAINPATPTVSVTGGAFSYDGNPHAATATATGVGGATVAGTLSFTYNGSSTPPTNAGTYAVVATFTSSDPNYTNTTGKGTITISTAQGLLLSVTGGTFTFDGAAHPAAAAATVDGTPVPGTFSFTYNGDSAEPTNAGTYDVLVTFTPDDTTNYEVATASGTIVINPAMPTVVVTGGTFAYDGSPHPAKATATGVGGATVAGTFSFTYNGSSTPPTNAGTYAVVATFASGDPNYSNATGTGSITITAGPSPASCEARVTVIIRGGGAGIPVKASVGGTEQPTLSTGIDSSGLAAVQWVLHPPSDATWTVAVTPQPPAGQVSPASATALVGCGGNAVVYFDMAQSGQPAAQATGPVVLLPVTGGEPAPVWWEQVAQWFTNLLGALGLR